MSMITPPHARHRWQGLAPRALRLLGLLLLTGLAIPAPRLGQEVAPTPPAPAPAPSPAAPADEFGRGVPRSAVRGLLDACWSSEYERAANYLDLRRIAPAARAEQGTVRARQLCAVIDRTLWVEAEQFPETAEGETQDGLPTRREWFGTIETAKGPVRLLLERVPRDDGTLIWKLSSESVARIPALYEEFGPGPLADILPRAVFEFRLFRVQVWQWAGVLVLVVLACALGWVLSRVLVRLLSPLVRHTTTVTDDTLLKASAGPLWLSIALLLLYLATPLLALSVRAQAVTRVLGILGLLAGVAWLLMRTVDVAAAATERRLVGRRHVARSFVPLARRSAKVFMAILWLLVALQNVGVDVTSVLAGLGIGGLAIALAAQKTVENLFGSVTLVADQPVRVGDVCRFGNTIGTVEDIGLRSTRVRTPDRTIVVVPNAEFATMQIENLSRRDRIFLQATIGVRYETSPDQLRWLLIELRKLLLAHPKVASDPARVRFVRFGSYSLDIEISAYLLTDDFDEFAAIREDVWLRMMDVVAASGSGFAFPSQTIYSGKDEGLDAGRTRAAEAEVARWRADNALCLPDVPPEQVAALDNTLEYPPPGSALRRSS